MKRPVTAAFGVSLLIHLALYGGWIWGESLGLWDHQATWLLHWKEKKVKTAQARSPQTPPLVPQSKKEIPLTFIEVDPATATPAPPQEDTIYYGAQNSKAANPSPSEKSTVPKSDGTQSQVPRLADVPREQPPPRPPQPPAELKPEPLKPAPAKEEPPPAETGNQDVVERFLTPTQAQPDPTEKAVVRTRPRPRTLEEARARLNLPGRKLKQEGGVRRAGLLSFDVRATEFGSYDAAFIAAVQKRWYDLIDSRAAMAVPRSGKVIIEFRLTYDGRITDMRVGRNDVGEILGLLCERAVLDPAPYAKWPSDMRRKMGNSRDVTFTFYYN